MHSHRALRTARLSILFSVLLAACSVAGDEVVGPDALYDDFVGTWAATSFVISEEDDSAPPVDLTQPNPSRGQHLEVTLHFAEDRTGAIEFDPDRGSAENEKQSEKQTDTFSIAALTSSHLTLTMRGDDLDDTVVMEHFRSPADSSLTLRYPYRLDFTGRGQREPVRVIAVFERAY